MKIYKLRVELLFYLPDSSLAYELFVVESLNTRLSIVSMIVLSYSYLFKKNFRLVLYSFRVALLNEVYLDIFEFEFNEIENTQEKIISNL